VDGDGSNNWLILYREAVQESDPQKSKVRIAQAQRAIELRAHELWYAGSADRTERNRLDAASNLLAVLRTIGHEPS